MIAGGECTLHEAYHVLYVYAVSFIVPSGSEAREQRAVMGIKTAKKGSVKRNPFCQVLGRKRWGTNVLCCA